MVVMGVLLGQRDAGNWQERERGEKKVSLVMVGSPDRVT